MKTLLALLFMAPLAFGAGHYGNVWRHKAVSVCFAQGSLGPTELAGYELNIQDWKQDHKEDIIRWVNEEYSPERTGIHFTGFENCTGAGREVIVYYNKNSRFRAFFKGSLKGLGSVGPSLNVVPEYPQARAFVSISKTGLKKGVVVHEFGHVAVLTHEHNHPDTPPNACKYADPQVGNGIEYDAYDPRSVMNYCWIHSSQGRSAGLSASDLSLLRRLYP